MQRRTRISSPRWRRGTFREDLYYRLNVVQIHVPPLRERKEDILLVQHFIKEFNVSLGKEFAGVSPQAMNHLARYDWPGNVRELKNAIEAAMLLGEARSSCLSTCLRK